MDRHELAARLRSVVMEAGGAQIWIKRSARLHAAPSSDASLQVLATPAAYAAVRSRVQQEADKAHLDLGVAASKGEGGLQAATLTIMEASGQHVLQVHLREVSQLLRAAIVIDDMGNNLETARKLMALDYPLTFSVLPSLHYSRQTAEEAHRRGLEVMLHLPMEPEASSHVPAGEGAIRMGMSAAAVQGVIRNDLATVPFAAGVNNHMGSRATADRALMAEVMDTLADRRLYFIDSRTTAATVALDVARRRGLPAFYRTVFLDDTETVPYTLGQLREFRHTVEQQGEALAIGHPHATTISALEKFLPELEGADIELVAPSEIVRLPETTHLHPPSNPGK